MKTTIIIVALSLTLMLAAVLVQADDTDLVWSTFLGGSNGEGSSGDIAVDVSGCIYIVAFTSSADFPTTAGAFDNTLGGGSDVFVTKLNPTGSNLVYSTFLGGGNSDWAYGIAIDSAGNAYVTGITDSYDFPVTPEAFDTSLNDTLVPPSFDAFVTKLNPPGTDLVYSTYLGGYERDDEGFSIAVDDSGHAYLTGGSRCADFPVTGGAFDITYNGNLDIFVTKLNSAGSDLDYSTFLGGDAYEEGYNIAVDDSGKAYITGGSQSADFPTTAGAFDDTYNGGSEYGGDAYVVKLNSLGNALDYATFLGGNEEDAASSIAIDGSGCAYLVGATNSSGFPTTAGAFDNTYNGNGDGFVAKFNQTGDVLEFATFIGGNDYDGAWGIVLGNDGSIHISGQTESDNFPIISEAYDVTYNGGTDVFVGKLNPTASDLVYSTFLGGTDFDYASWGIAIDGSDQTCLLGGTYSTDFPTTAGSFDPTYNGVEDAFVVKLDLSGYYVPVVLVSFEAIDGQGFIALKWITASEVNCHRWDIYRSEQEDDEYSKVGELSGHGSTEMASTYRWIDSDLDADITYFYKLEQIDFDGTSWWSQVVSAAAISAIPQSYVLDQNYPNPFNSDTQIKYQLPQDNHVTLKIYNVTGQEIVTLVDDDLTAGTYTATWNGLDANLTEVSAGVYFCTMKAAEFTDSRKMVLLR